MHEAALRAYLRNRFPTLQDQDDLVQESYAKLIRGKAMGKVRNVKAYLFAMARNTAFDIFRRNRMIPIGGLDEMEQLGVLTYTPDASAVADHDRELDILAEAIQSLPERCRRVVTLRKIDGLSYREVAEKLGITENTVNAQLANGAWRIREFLRARGLLKGRPNEK